MMNLMLLFVIFVVENTEHGVGEHYSTGCLIGKGHFTFRPMTT
jgi:hypothetical protein